MTTLIQRSLAKGELDPSLHSRVDSQAYATGLKTCKNFQVMKTGSLQNRPGLQFVAEVKDSTKDCVLVDFDFGNDDSYILEFGEGSIRVHRYGVQQREAAKAIAAITQAAPGVATVTAHGWSSGDELYGSDDIGGMIQLRKRNVKIQVVSADTFSLQDMAGNDLDTSAYTAFTSGGSFARVYSIATPYAELHLRDLSYAQSFDVLKLAHKLYAPADLTRFGHTQWTLGDISFVPSIAAPSNLVVSGSTGTARYYVVTAVKKETGEESYVSNEDTASTAPTTVAPRSLTWTGNSDARQYKVYAHEGAGVYGLIAVTGSTAFTDTGFTPDYSKTPPVSRVSIDGLGSSLTQQVTATFPVTALGGVGRCMAWHDYGAYSLVVMGNDTASFVRLLLYQDGDFTDITANIDTAPGATVRGAAFSPSGTYLALAAHTSPFVFIYKINGLTLNKLANPAALPAGNANAVAWTTDENALIVAHATSPFVTFYLRSGDTFTKQANPSTLPTAQGNALAVDFYPSTGVHYVFVAHNYSAPRSVTFYKITAAGAITGFSSTVFNSAIGTDNALAAAVNLTSKVLSVGASGGDFLYNFAILSGGSTSDLEPPKFSLFPDPDSKPTAAVNGLHWRPDDRFLAAATSGADKLMIYAKTGTQFLFQDIVNTDLAGNGNAVAWSPDSSKLAAAHATADYATLYLVEDINPGVVGFCQQRFLLGSTLPEPNRAWASAINNFKNFNQKDPLTEEQGFSFAPASWKFNEIRHFLDLGRLICLTYAGEYVLKGNAAGGLTPFSDGQNPQQQSQNGASKVRPVIVDDSVVFADRSGGSLRDLFYQFESDGFRGNDLSATAKHLFEGRQVVSVAFQARPNSVVWVVFDDGTAAGVTFNKAMDVIGWHRLETEGTFLWVRCVPEGGLDVPSFLVQRTIGGREVKMIEKLTNREAPDQDDLVFVDSAVTYNGWNDTDETMRVEVVIVGPETQIWATRSQQVFVASDVGRQIWIESPSNGIVGKYEIVAINPSGTEAHQAQVEAVRDETSLYDDLVGTTEWALTTGEVDGLWHLEGEQVAVQADGWVLANPNNPKYTTPLTVSSGRVTLPIQGAVVHVGLPYLCDIETLDIDTPGGGTFSNKKMLVKKVALRVKSTLGLMAGRQEPDEDDDANEGLRPLKIRRLEVIGEPTEPFTGVLEVTIQSRWNSNGRVFIRQLDPLPATILSIAPSGAFPNV